MCIVLICFDIELMTIMDLEYAYLIAGEHRVFQLERGNISYKEKKAAPRFRLGKIYPVGNINIGVSSNESRYYHEQVTNSVNGQKKCESCVKI